MNTQSDLALAERRRALLETMRHGVLEHGADGQIIDANPAARAMLGLAKDEDTGALSADPGWSFLDANGRTHAEGLQDVLCDLAASGSPQARLGARRPSGQTAWLDVRTAALTGQHGQQEGIVTSLVDITEQIDAERQLTEERASLATILEHLTDGVVVCDATGQVLQCNPAAEKFHRWDLVGTTAIERIEICPIRHFDGRHFTPEELPTQIAASGGVAHEIEMLMGPPGAELVALVSATPLPGRDGSPGGIVVTLRDITERKAVEIDLFRQTRTDVLTGLANRRGLKDHLARLHAREGDGSDLALIMVDLDNFKEVNDVHGHEVGDAVLVACAERIASVARDTDVVARLGGDEFVLVCPGVAGPEQAQRLALRVEAALEPPVVIGGTEVAVGASAGVTLALGIATPKELLRAGDRAMYARKKLRRQKASSSS